MQKNAPKFRIGMMLFPDIVQLDFAGPYEVFARTPTFETVLVAKTMTPVRTKFGLTVLPDATFDNVGSIDMICIPGGAGVDPLLNDPETLAFIRNARASARYMTAVCTGTLLLGAAGLLAGRKATTHWSTAHLLKEFGCTYTPERYVFDGDLVTGAGVTSGIDFGLAVVDRIMGREVAAEVMLAIEYTPHPPFIGGQVDNTDPAIVDAYRHKIAAGQAVRAMQVRKAVAHLDLGQ
jgi:cyclohexyl-isocyanide hydratase